MNITDYHAKYYAHELTRQGGQGVDRLSRSLFDACVDLNPHQIEAALFALRSPITKGVLLADEVGLGKTIEAGLAICQIWAENKRNILVICPASLRKQWSLELEEKFNLPTIVLDAKSYKQSQRDGTINPFMSNAIVICSMHFASNKSEDLRAVKWSLAVIDEAHKLRNAYRQSNRMGQNIRWALEDNKKILLTATPLQNSLLELYGLTTIIDENIFGDASTFRNQYINSGGNLDELRERLRTFCKRTLRQHVSEYINYTERKPVTQKFQPTEKELKLYNLVSDFLRRDNTYALPARQRHLTTLIIRKLLASSTEAVSGTLETMRERLMALRDNKKAELSLAEQIIEDEDIEEEILDEISDDDIDENSPESPNYQDIDLKKLNAEIEEITSFIKLAQDIGVNTKTEALVIALKLGFKSLTSMGANKKAIIFTESRRTQKYLYEYLTSNGYEGQVLTFNGTNKEPETTKVYDKWLEENKDTGRIAGSRPVDVRTAIIEHFRDHASILIATEAAAEGINLQFCSLVVNYDLPWNPQRIEQRIGRCHRYGQEHDVVVVNFLNEKNEADRRVFELLEMKFKLFSGVFGASDEVLGTIESGVDFERRILDIYQQCRTSEEIKSAFENLQQEMDSKIESRMNDTREMLMEHFDEDVHERFKANLSGTKENLDKFSKIFWALTKHMLNDSANFDESTFSFLLDKPPLPDIHRGTYHLISKEHYNIPGDFLYRLSHPLGEHVITEGKSYNLPVSDVSFNISDHQTKISVIENLQGKSGWLTLKKLVIDSFDREEYLLFTAFDENGKNLDQETCRKLFSCTGELYDNIAIPEDTLTRLTQDTDRYEKATINQSLEANNEFFAEGRDQLEKWADDMVLSVERELYLTKEQIKQLNRQSRQAPTMEEQQEIQERIKKLETQKRRQRQKIFDVEDEIIKKRDRLIDELEKRMVQKSSSEELFTIHWKVV